MGIENLNSRLLGALARAYNNDRKLKRAIEIMDRIPESDRDAIWYYIWIYLYLLGAPQNRFEKDAKARNV